MLHFLLDNLFQKTRSEHKSPQGREGATLDMKPKSPPRRLALVSSSLLPALIIPWLQARVNSQYPRLESILQSPCSLGKAFAQILPPRHACFSCQLSSLSISQHQYLFFCSMLHSRLKLFFPQLVSPASLPVSHSCTNLNAFLITLTSPY